MGPQCVMDARFEVPHPEKPQIALAELAPDTLRERQHQVECGALTDIEMLGVVHETPICKPRENVAEGMGETLLFPATAHSTRPSMRATRILGCAMDPGFSSTPCGDVKTLP